jgi:hypothetical protein
MVMKEKPTDLAIKPFSFRSFKDHLCLFRRHFVFWPM